MEKLIFTPKPKLSHYDICKSIADKMHEPVTKWLGRLRGISDQDILKIKESAEKASNDSSMSFSKSMNWILKSILK